MELRAPAVGPARAYIRSAGLTGNPSKRWRSGRGDLRRPGPPLGAEVPSVRGRDSSGKMGGVHVKVVGRWGGSGVGGRDVRVGRGRVEDWLATARLRGVQSGCTACRVVARRAGWLHGVQGGCSACRVVARRAGWLHGVQGGCMACRVVARRAGWLHGVQGGCTACSQAASGRIEAARRRSSFPAVECQVGGNWRASAGIWRARAPKNELPARFLDAPGRAHADWRRKRHRQATIQSSGRPFNRLGCAPSRGRPLPELPPSLVGAVVQLVRIPACHAGGRGFESRPLRQSMSL